MVTVFVEMRGKNMEAFLLILFMVVVGAVVGGATNYLAIKMLFRPHNPIYLGKSRLPFTPGLIPKRREEIARHLGNTVSDYLLTPEVFKNKFFHDDMKQKALHFAQSNAEKYILTKEKTIQDWLNLFGLTELPKQLEGKVEDIVATQFDNVKNTLSTKSIDELLPKDIHQYIERKIPELVTLLLEKGEDYLLSPEGENTIKNLLDNFLSGKGFFGNIFSFLSDSSSVTIKIQSELVKIINSPETKDFLIHILSGEWNKLKAKPAMDYLKEIDFDNILYSIQNYAKKELQIENRLNKPILEYWPDGERYVNNELLPMLINIGFEKIESNLVNILNKINLAELVREQVDSFPIAKLEEIVIGIASRELQMITFLGAFIGGLVGIFQGLIVLLFN